MTKDPGLEAYVLAIERHFRTLRGKDQALAPRDFALARSFHDAGIPLANVLVGIDRAFDSDQDVSSLTYCRRRIEELSEGLGARGAREGYRGETGSLPVVEDALARLEERLLELRGTPSAAFGLVLVHVRELRDLVAVAARPNWEYLRAKLLEIDRAVSDAAPQALDPEDARAIEAEKERSAERHRGHVDDAALARALERLARARSRERLRLPRVSVL